MDEWTEMGVHPTRPLIVLSRRFEPIRSRLRLMRNTRQKDTDLE